MPEIIALFSVLIPHLSATTTHQLSQVNKRPCTACDDRARNNVKYLSLDWTGR